MMWTVSDARVMAMLDGDIGSIPSQHQLPSERGKDDSPTHAARALHPAQLPTRSSRIEVTPFHALSDDLSAQRWTEPGLAHIKTS